MASTNYTTHYSIPLPLGTDLTTPMDYNESAEAVDAALFAAETDAGSASEAAANAIDIANAASDAVSDIASDLSIEKAKIVVLQTRVASMENEIDDVRSDAEDAICAYNEPTATSSHAYAIGDYFFYNDTLFKATVPIAIGDTIVANTNCVATNVMSEISSNVGDLANLTTTDKSSAVAAINEVNEGLSNKVDILGSVQVIADGVKTHGALLNELFNLRDASKVRESTVLSIDTTLYPVYQTGPTGDVYNSMRLDGSDLITVSQIVLVNNSSSFTIKTEAASAVIHTNTVPTAGTVIKLTY